MFSYDLMVLQIYALTDKALQLVSRAGLYQSRVIRIISRDIYSCHTLKPLHISELRGEGFTKMTHGFSFHLHTYFFALY